MKPVAFDYCRPESVEQAVALLRDYRGEASLLAGGMSLGAMLNMRLVRPAAVIDLKGIRALDRYELRGEQVWTGALLRQADALAAPDLLEAVPLLAQALPHVGHFQTRNRGTLGGSVAHADPSAEIPLCLVALDGKVELAGRRGRRTVAARDFFTGAMTTARAADEVLTGLLWPRAKPGAAWRFDEIAQRHGDFAIAAVAAGLRVEDGRVREFALALGGVEDRPVALDTRQWIGERPDPAAIADWAAAQAQPTADFKASAEYRRALVRTLVARVLA